MGLDDRVVSNHKYAIITTGHESGRSGETSKSRKNGPMAANHETRQPQTLPRPTAEIRRRVDMTGQHVRSGMGRGRLRIMPEQEGSLLNLHTEIVDSQVLQ
jgi:hypothetical protein